MLYYLYHTCLARACAKDETTSFHKLGVLSDTHPAHVFSELGASNEQHSHVNCVQHTVQGWERGSHGTGMGHTTNKGFWIPEKPPTPPAEEMLALPEAPRAGGRGATGRPSRKHPRLPAGPKLPRGGGRQPKEIKQETDQESQHEDEPPEVCIHQQHIDKAS